MITPMGSTRDFDLIVVKSPHTEHHMYDAWVDANFNVDVAGATSANLNRWATPFARVHVSPR